MKMTTMAVVTALMVGHAAAQEAPVPDARGPYFAGGVQAGAEFEFCDEGDDECSEGGYGVLGRLGYRANRVLSAEAEVGIAAFGGDDAFAHAAGLAVVTLPVGPVDLRLRAGPSVFSADEEARFGFAVGPGVGFRPNDRSAIRADILILQGDDPDEGAGFDLGGLFQIAYERRF